MFLFQQLMMPIHCETAAPDAAFSPSFRLRSATQAPLTKPSMRIATSMQQEEAELGGRKTG